MIDRVGFAKAITSDNLEKNIQNFFDQAMALYDLLGSRDDLDINANGTDNGTKEKDIEFILLTDSKDEANQLYEMIDGHTIPIYGHLYKPELRNSKNSVHIALVDTKNKEKEATE